MAIIPGPTQAEMDAEAIKTLKRAKRDLQPYGLWKNLAKTHGRMCTAAQMPTKDHFHVRKPFQQYAAAI